MLLYIFYRGKGYGVSVRKMRRREKPGRKGREMKRNAAVFIMVLGICSVCLAGCADSMHTEEELVAPKGEEAQEQQEQEGAVQEEAAQAVQGEAAGQAEGAGAGEGQQEDAAWGNVASQVQAPERYRNELSVDGVNVKIDACLVIPDVPGIKTKTVTGRVFTQEDYDTVNRALLGGGSLWERDYDVMEATNGFTVGEIEEKIAALERARDVDGADGNEPYGDKEETLNEQIGQWEERKEAGKAAGLEEPVIVEVPAVVGSEEAGTFPEDGEGGNGLSGYVTKDGEDYYVRLSNDLTPEWRLAEFAVEGMRKKGSFASVLESEQGKYAEKIAALGLDTESIQAQAQDLVTQMGIGGIALQGGEYMANYKLGDVGKEVYDQFVYGVHAVRVEDGVPVTYTYADGGNVSIGDDFPDGAAWIWWPYEEMTLIYDEKGIVSFLWRNPYEVKALSSDYVFLMPFSDIQNIFEEMIVKKKKDTFNGEGESFDITVDEVRLGYMRVREMDSAEGTLVPVWDFFGAETWKDAEGREYYSRDSDYISLLTINAMDGTVLDREAGF